MALPDYLKNALGTASVWGEAGASGVTNTLSLDALNSGSGRMSAAVDLGVNWDQEYILFPVIESGTAPTAGGSIDIYLAFSYDNSNWPAGVSGSDNAWPADGNEDEWAKQLGWPDIQVISTNDSNVQQKQNQVIIKPRGRYVVCVVDNNWDQSTRDETTASDNDSRIYLIPLQSLLVD